MAFKKSDPARKAGGLIFDPAKIASLSLCHISTKGLLTRRDLTATDDIKSVVVELNKGVPVGSGQLEELQDDPGAERIVVAVNFPSEPSRYCIEVRPIHARFRNPSRNENWWAMFPKGELWASLVRLCPRTAVAAG